LEQGPDVAVEVKYHDNYPGATDPYYLYNTTENMARYNYYGGNGAPKLRVDGILDYTGWSDWNTYINWVRSALSTRRGIASPCRMDVSVSTLPFLSADTLYVTVNVTAETDMHNTDQRLFVALVHRCIKAAGDSKMRYHVFRNMWPSTTGYSFQLDRDSTLTYTVACTTSTGWDINDLRIVAFVQRYNTKEVLQSAYADVITSPLVINEFMANNVSAVQDPAGDYDDWIEIYNAGDGEIHMLGKSLTNQCTDWKKWMFPDVSIPAGGHLVVWCDNELAEPGIHANFTLTNTADTLVMYDTSATCNFQIDRIIYPAQSQDISLGRVCDGMPTWVQFTTPTPGTANSGCADSVQNLTVLVEGNSLQLFWQPYTWATSYTIYRNDIFPFEPRPGDSVGAVTDTNFVDRDILLTLPSAFYRVKARL
jgi:Lamin Tail Domain